MGYGRGPDAIRDELRRVVGSPPFKDADRLVRFLTYIVEETLAGHGDRVKESTIGIEVFDREAGYDPKADPIVRVQARRLRVKLESCYQDFGHTGVRIALPKGGYVPEFHSQGAASLEAGGHRRRKWVVTTVLILILAAGAIVVGKRRAGTAPNVAKLFTAYPGYQTRPMFSPDGMSITFSWAGPEDDNSDIYVQRLDADTPRRITTSPAQESMPAWLPDGAQIGFLREEAPNRMAVIVVPLLGSGERRVAHIQAGASDPPRMEWSHDGKRLYTSEKAAPDGPFRIVEISLESGERGILTQPAAGTPGDNEAALSPDGKWIAFRRRSESSIDDAFVIPVEGGTPRAVTQDRAGIVGLAWSRDNRALIISSRRSSSLQRLWRFPIGGGEPVCLTDAALAASYPAISPRDGLMAYTSRFLDTNVWRVDLEGKTPSRRLIASNLLDSSAHYSPDGSRIAFRSNRTGNDELWVADANGEAPARLTNFGGPVTGDSRWSPDGQYLVFSSRPYGHADIFVVPSGGGRTQRLTQERSNEVLPSFSADGKSVYFASDRTGKWQIWKQPVKGGAAQQITRRGGFAPLESPDGKWLYYSKSDADGLFRLPLSGGEETRVVDLLPPSLWGGWGLAGGDVIYLKVPGAGGAVAELLTLNPSTGQTRRTGGISFPPISWDGALGVSPDGKYALVSEVERAGSEIHLLKDK
jgi:Tol biopolymer transport system component